MRQHYLTLPPAPSTLNPHLSAAIDAVILRALAKQPDERFASVTAFARAFHEAVESERRTAGTFLWLAGISVPLAGVVLYFVTSGRPVIRGAATARRWKLDLPLRLHPRLRHRAACRSTQQVALRNPGTQRNSIADFIR